MRVYILMNMIPFRCNVLCLPFRRSVFIWIFALSRFILFIYWYYTQFCLLFRRSDTNTHTHTRRLYFYPLNLCVAVAAATATAYGYCVIPFLRSLARLATTGLLAEQAWRKMYKFIIFQRCVCFYFHGTQCIIDFSYDSFHGSQW